MRSKLLLVLLLIFALVLAACGGSSTPTPAPTRQPTAVPTDVPAEEQAAEEEVEAVEEGEAEAAEEATAEVAEEVTEEAAEEEAEAVEEEATEEAAEEGTVVEEAQAASDFTTLVAALTAADLAETLQGTGPFTVFAPTDEAFAAALSAMGMTAEQVLGNTELLTSVLLYHVVSGSLNAADIVALDGQTLTTLQGGEIAVSLSDDGGVVLNGTTNVILADVPASNGVIHAIDGVLLPSMAAAEEEEEAAPVEEGTGAPMTITSACMVTDQGGVNDGTFNQLAADAMRRAEETFGLEISIIESNTPSDFEPNINTCLDTGAGAVVTVGFLLGDATLAAAQANPNVYFIGVDQFFAGHPSNLVGIQSREDQAGFLVGVMAGLLTESNVIGGVYGIDVPAVVKFRNGFEAGARYVNADVTALGSYLDSFIDAAAGAELAEALIGDGADIIFGAGGGTGSGGIIYAASQGIRVIGVDQDEYFTTFGGGESPGAEFIITSAVKRIDVGVFDMLAALVDGSVEWQGGGLYLLEAANGGIGFTESHDADVPQEVIDRVNEVFEMLRDGSLSTGIDPVTGFILEEEAAPEEAAAEEMAEAPASDFTTLLMAVEATGLTELLSGEGPFTVFAPTNAAIEATLASLGLTPDALLGMTDVLTGVLQYHVVEGILTSADIAAYAEAGRGIPTVEGSGITPRLTESGAITLERTVNIILADVPASNGIIHVIDSVLIPTGVPAVDPSAAPEEEGMGAPMTITSACMVTDQGGVNDGTFNQLAADAMRRAEETFGLEISIIESNTPSDFEPNINTCLDTGAGAVVTVGFLLGDATLAAAQANPNVYFIGVDQFFAGHPNNLVGIQSREDQAGFLVGVMAGLLTESNVIGGVYGIDVPAVVKFRNGFEAGARYVNADVTALGSYLDSFIDAAAGAELAEALIGDGADIIFGAGGGTGSGGIIYAASQGIRVIGVDQDEYFTTFGGGESPGAEFIITSAVKRIDVGVFDMLAALVDGSVEWQGGGLYLLEAANGGIGFTESHDADVPQEVIDRVNEVFEMLRDGSLSTGIDPVTGFLLED